MPDSTLFLIDAHALCYRSFFAIKSLSTSYGQATNAVYGFTNTLKKILKDYQPQYLAVCFDTGKKTHRQEKFAEYKIHRPAMPDDLISQLPLIKDVVTAFQLPIFEMDGFEADDVIATLATKVPEKNLDVVIVSGDKDMMQLLSDRVKMFHMRSETIMDRDDAQKTLGIDPTLIPDFLGLAGDQTDNIPGVLGIGEVTAKALINEFGTMENIYANIDKVRSDKVREKLIEQKDKAFFSKELAILDMNVPLKFSLDSLEVKTPDSRRLFELFRKLEFRRFAEEFATTESVAPVSLNVKTLENQEDIDGFLKTVKKAGAFAFVIDLPEGDDGVMFGGMALSVGGDKAYYVSIDRFEQLKSIFEDSKIIKVVHDIKENLKILAAKGLRVAGEAFDVMLAGYLIAPSQGSFDLKHLGWTYLKVSFGPEGHPHQSARALFDLYAPLKAELESKSLMKLFQDVEIPLARVLFHMESDGVSIDEELLRKLSRESERKIESLVGQIFKHSGMEFNLNSPKQLSHVLFEKLKLPIVKKTKTGLSTDEGVLIKLAAKHALPALILDYRQLTKLKSTYIDALPKLVDAKTERLHATFNQTGTETGRLSSNNPNLQNIPIRTELGREIRRAFVAGGQESLMISADYSQIELRILAHLSQDKNLIQAFQEDQDIHSFTAAQIFEVKESDVTSAMRNSAKRVNFGIIYGMSAFGLAKDLEISQSEAQDFIDRYFSRYPSVKKFMDNEIQEAQKRGYVLTLLNRRRYLPDLNSSNMAIRQLAQRQAINTPVQGSAADLIKLAMINISAELEKKSLKSKMIITVHDELVFDCARKEKDAMVELIRECMEHPITLSVPIKADIKIGLNWLEMKKV